MCDAICIYIILNHRRGVDESRRSRSVLRLRRERGEKKRGREKKQLVVKKRNVREKKSADVRKRKYVLHNLRVPKNAAAVNLPDS